MKLDSASSLNLTGDRKRLKEVADIGNVYIKGFSQEGAFADLKGINEDGFEEYYVESMPEDLVLLCANIYAQDGAVILLKDRGVVVSLSEDEEVELNKFIKGSIVTKNLKVVNNTYEIKEPEEEEEYEGSKEKIRGHEAFVATQYFNSSVHVKDSRERVLSLMLSGLSFEDLKNGLKGSIDGLPRELSISQLVEFEKNYGRTPNVIRLSHPRFSGNAHQYFVPEKELTKVGALVEADIMEAEFNHEVLVDGKNVTRKLPSLGGAIAAFVVVDVYSGYVWGKLMKNKEPFGPVKKAIEFFGSNGYTIEEFCADNGIVNNSSYRVVDSKVESFLSERKIRSRSSEPYNHNNGTSHVERAIRSIKELQRMAFFYVLTNDNLKRSRFCNRDVLKCWGEIFHWAIQVINLRTSRSLDLITKYEVFHKVKPDLRNIRLLPIFSFLQVKYQGKSEVYPAYRTNVSMFVNALYVGPSHKVKGAIRAMIRVAHGLEIITTSEYKAVSDGGDIDIYKNIQNNLIGENINGVISESNIVSSTEGISNLNTESNIDINIKNINNANDGNDISLSIEDLNRSIIGDTDNHDLNIIESNTNLIEDIKKSTDGDTNKISEINGNTSKKRDKKKKEVNFEEIRKSSRLAEKKNVGNIFDASVAEAYYIDWSNYKEENIYYDFENSVVIKIEEIIEEEAYRAIKGDVPRTFSKALNHPDWGEPARKEFRTLTEETGALIEISKDVADELINDGAEMLKLLTVFEEKVKEGELVRKVRLVADGRSQTKVGNIYASTPSKEEFLLLLDGIAALGIDFYHVDEVRAFLNADRTSEDIMLTKIEDDRGIRFFEVVKSLYGAKDSPRNYQLTNRKRLKNFGFKQLELCESTYIKKTDLFYIIVLAYVDDFLITGNNQEEVKRFIIEFRSLVNTTDPVLNPCSVLGHGLIRDLERNIIKVNLNDKITYLVNINKEYLVGKCKSLPMPTDGMVIDTEKLGENEKKKLNYNMEKSYLANVGALVWISSIRKDIVHAVQYLTWFTKNPLVHHWNMAISVISYLNNSKELSLEIGGHGSQVDMVAQTDASLSTGPKGRTVIGNIVKLGYEAGAVFVKSMTSKRVRLSSFEAELNGYMEIVKSILRIKNIMEQFGLVKVKNIIVYGDNIPAIEYLRDENSLRGTKYMEKDFYFIKENFIMENINCLYLKSEELAADCITKVKGNPVFKRFLLYVLGGNIKEGVNNIF